MTSLRRRFRWYWLPVLALLVLLVGSTASTLLADSPLEPTERDRAAAARVERGLAAKATDERIDLPVGPLVAGNGVVEPFGREVQVAGEDAGRIAELLVREGQRVEAGAALLRFDDALQRAALASAAADLEAARAELLRLERGSRSEEIAQAAAEARAAGARARLAETVAERTRRLADSGVATVDDAERAREQASAERSAARAAGERRKLLEAGPLEEELMLARARIAGAEARLAQARAQLERRTVRAPSAGEVLQLKYRAGEYYLPGQGEPLLLLGDTSRLQVRLDLDERDIGRVAPGHRATVVVQALPGVHFHGTVTELGRRVGRKNVRSDDPVERNDSLILEVLITLDGGTGLVPRQRVLGYLQASPAEGCVLGAPGADGTRDCLPPSVAAAASATATAR